MRSTKKFIHIPEYPGGKEAFLNYIKENLKYPKEALENKIQGTVYLSAEIDDNGKAGIVHIEKGIGFGCDEEAVRLITNVQYGSVKNKGMRLKTRKKFRIQFKLPTQPMVSFSLVNKKEMSQKISVEKKYNYSIKIN